MQKRHTLNYLYFGLLFILLTLLHVLHVFLVEDGSSLNRVFYAAYAAGQCLIEIGALVLIGAWVTEKFPASLRAVYVSGTFLLFLMHLIDFPLMRIMDMSIWYSFAFVFDESLDNFIQLLKASNIHLITWLLMGMGAAVLIFLGLLLFRVTKKLSAWKAFHFSYQEASLFLASTLGLLVLFDYHASEFAAPSNDSSFLKALPWKSTFFTRNYPRWSLQAQLPQRPSEEWHRHQLNQLTFSASHKPNIYLFIVESLREDFITPENAPVLSQFRQQHLSFPCAISAANATPISWFSIFHSIYPFEWRDRRPSEWSLGSLPLQIFKKAGYKIHLLSASQLLFYQMDEVIFGKGHALADDYHVFADHEELENHAYDAKCIDHLIEKMQNTTEGSLFIVFLEGTHFDYSWPSHLKLPLSPAAEAIDYLQISYSKEGLEGIKNRYRHAIYHIDHQFDRFLTALKAHPKSEEAVVVFTSDHGEEFFEEGRLFHASNLNRVQTHIPLYYQLGKSSITQAPALTSHLDIFPTLIEYVIGKNVEWFDGESALRPRQRNFAISARYNASRNPYEFLITTETERLVTRFENRRNIRFSKALEFISRKDPLEQSMSLEMEDVQARYKAILDHLFPGRFWKN